MVYNIRFTPSFEEQLKKTKKKDKPLFEELTKKILQIAENPEHYKPLKGILKGTQRAHAGPFVIIFEIHGSEVIFHYVKHHDRAY